MNQVHGDRVNVHAAEMAVKTVWCVPSLQGFWD